VNGLKILGLGLLLSACDDPLKSVELVAEPRVLGARVEVEGDAHRAAPAPGEAATVTLLVASPEPSPAFGFALSACPAAPRNGARAACEGEVFSRTESREGQEEAVRLSFEVPTSLDPSGRVLVYGVVCPQGSPTEDGGCDEGSGTSLQLELELAREDDVNSNPELEADSLLLDDEPWSALLPAEGDCAGLGLPEVAPQSDHSITVQLDEDDRDPLPRPSELDPAREALQLSHFVSDGDISRAFESIPWDSDELTRTATWRAPATPGLVRFWFVLRDLRGGGAFSQRVVCVK
jgi:hypothetical protein